MAIYPGLCYLWEVGLNSSGDSDKDSSCWELVLQGDVRLVVGLSGGVVGCPGGSHR